MNRLFPLLLGCLFLASPLAAQPVAGSALDQIRVRAEGATFIENLGQWPDGVTFLARLPGVDVWVTSTGLLYDFYEREPARSAEGRRGRVVEARFVGGQAKRVEGLRPQSAYHNYLLGNDPSQWATRVPLYDEVVLREVYDGVSLRLYADGGVLRQELVLGPAADPAAVRVEIEGVEGLDLSGAGVLDRATVLGIEEPLSGSPFRSGLQAPDGFGAQGGGMRQQYARFLGGTSDEVVRALALDADGSVYFGGRTGSDDFPTPNGYDQERQGGRDDAYLAQVSADGSQLYGTYIGGDREDEVRGVAYANASAYLTGVTKSPDFPTTPGAYEEGGSDDREEDAFVMRLRTDGSGPVFATYLGGSGPGAGKDDAGAAIAVTATGSVVVGGRTESDGFPVPNGAYDKRGDAFVVVLSGDGTAVQGGTFLGGDQLDEIRALKLGNGSIYVAGDTRSDNFAGFGGGFGGDVDAFVARLSEDGNALLSGTFIGGSGLEGAVGNGGNDRTGSIAMALGADGTVYVSGDTDSDDFPATVSIGPLGGFDGFVVRLQADATSFLGGTLFGGSGTDRARGIAIAPDGTIHLAGETASDDFPVLNADDATYNQLGDAFIIQLTGDAAGEVYGTYLGGSEGDAAFDLAIGENGITYVVGETQSGTDFPVSAVSPTYQGGGDAFVAAYDLGNVSPVIVGPLADIALVVGDPPFAADLAGVFEDPDGDVLTYACSSSAPDVASVSDCSSGTLTVTAVAAGEATVTVTATDPVGASVSDAFVVTVATNLPPVVVAPPDDATLVLGDAPLGIDLAAVFTDPEGDALSYTCSSSAPGVASVGGLRGRHAHRHGGVGGARDDHGHGERRGQPGREHGLPRHGGARQPPADGGGPDRRRHAGARRGAAWGRSRAGVHGPRRRRADVRVFVECARYSDGERLCERHAHRDSGECGGDHDHRHGERSRWGERLGRVRGDGGEPAAGGGVADSRRVAGAGRGPPRRGPRHRFRRSQRRRTDVRVLVECAGCGVGSGLRGWHTDRDARGRGLSHDYCDGERRRPAAPPTHSW